MAQSSVIFQLGASLESPLGCRLAIECSVKQGIHEVQIITLQDLRFYHPPPHFFTTAGGYLKINRLTTFLVIHFILPQ